MRIAHFNTFPHGGAATAAMRIHAGLKGFRSSVVSSQFWYRSNEREPIADPRFRPIEFVPPADGPVHRAHSFFSHRATRQRQKQIYRLFDAHLANRPREMETFAMAELPESTVLNWPEIDADIAHLHWISFLADYPSFFDSIPRHVPLVWTLHDMNPLTGGCHYAGDCQLYRSGCGNCPQVIQPGSNDVSRHSFAAKQAALSKRINTVVAPSQWLLEAARSSSIWPETTSFHCIPYGLNLHPFRPVDKQLARRELGIETNGVLIGFGADDLNAPRKGICHLLNALRTVQGDSLDAKSDVPRVGGLLFGAGKVEHRDGLPELHEMGFVDSIDRQRLIYSAADFVVVPSLEDNQPQVALEAMACGTPVIAFDAGGIPEIVRHGVTGLLAKRGRADDLADQVAWLSVRGGVREQLGHNARKMMESEFEVSRQSARYIELYQSILFGAAPKLGQKARAA